MGELIFFIIFIIVGALINKINSKQEAEKRSGRDSSGTGSKERPFQANVSDVQQFLNNVKKKMEESVEPPRPKPATPKPRKPQEVRQERAAEPRKVQAETEFESSSVRPGPVTSKKPVTPKKSVVSAARKVAVAKERKKPATNAPRVAGIQLTTRNVKQAIILSEVLQPPISLR